MSDGEGAMAIDAALDAHERAASEKSINALINAFNLHSIGAGMAEGGDAGSLERLENIPSNSAMREAVLLLSNLGLTSDARYESFTPSLYIATLYNYLLETEDGRYNTAMTFTGDDTYMGYGEWSPLCTPGSGAFAMLTNHRDPLRIAKWMATHGLASLPQPTWAHVADLPLVHYAMHILDDVCKASVVENDGDGVPKSAMLRGLIASKEAFMDASAKFEALDGSEGPAVTVDVGYRLGCDVADFMGKCLRVFRWYLCVAEYGGWHRGKVAVAMASAVDGCDAYKTVDESEASPSTVRVHTAVAETLSSIPKCTVSHCLFFPAQ